jgi:hypothetical protein
MYRPDDFQLPETSNDWFEKGRYPWTPNWLHSGIPKNLANAQNVMAAYHACVSEMDDMVGRVVKALKDNNLYENTIIIYTSDHGEHLFEHGLRGKHNMYEDAVNVPFIVSYPKLFKQNVFNNSNVSLIDLMPTLAELINGVTPTTAQGISLVNVLKNNTEIKDRIVFSEFRGADYSFLPNVRNVPSRMMKKGDMKFIYTHGIIHQLYDLKNDPDELNNLIFSTAHQSIFKEMYFKTMAEWRFQEYFPMKASSKKNQISWNPESNFNEFSLFYSKTNNPKDAVLIKENIQTTTETVTEKGYYWVLANINFTKTGEHYGGKVPVAVDNHDFVLPISDPIQVK